MRVVFLGTAEIACPSLQALLDTPGVKIVGAITQPDRPAGRRLQTTCCATKAYAKARGVEIYTPANVNDPDMLALIRSWRPDIGVVMAYGQILKKGLLELPALGFINIHTSLLPKYRGAAPIQWAVANGETETGITIMQMDRGMDTGDILAQTRVPIGPHETSMQIHDRLAAAGATLLPTVLADIKAGRAVRRPQDPALATTAPKLTKADGRLDWTRSAISLFNQVRGFNPWPGCHFQYFCGDTLQTLRVMEARVECGNETFSEPGTVIGIHGGPLIACGGGALRLVRVQPEGGKIMEGTAFLCGRPLQVGNRFS